MAVERTLSIIKPDAVGKNVIGKIYSRFEEAGLKIIAAKMAWLSRQEAEGFYAVHRERPFFRDLVEFMVSGPVVIQVLEGENAIGKNRELMGATDPKKADKGTIRADFADSIDANAVHGSDAPETAKVEIAFFFPWAVVFGTANQLGDETVPAARRHELLHRLDADATTRLDAVRDRDPYVSPMPTPAAARDFAEFAFAELLTFFGILLVGFAYLWRRGDLEWVRSVAGQSPAVTANGPGKDLHAAS